RERERLAQTGGSTEHTMRIFRSPGALDALTLQHEWSIEQCARRREAVFQGRGVQEGLESRAGQALRLGHTVVFVGEVVEAADERRNAAVIGIQRHEGALRFRYLSKLRMAGGVGDDVDNIATGDNFVGTLGYRAHALIATGLARPGH